MPDYESEMGRIPWAVLRPQARPECQKSFAYMHGAVLVRAVFVKACKSFRDEEIGRRHRWLDRAYGRMVMEGYEDEDWEGYWEEDQGCSPLESSPQSLSHWVVAILIRHKALSCGAHHSNLKKIIELV